jgi:hypothetical protein
MSTSANTNHEVHQPGKTIFKWGRYWRGLLALVSLSALLAQWLGGSVTTSASTPLATGYLDFSYPSTPVVVSGPTGEKPESKLWWNDGFWWGSLYKSAAGAYHIYRLNWGTQTWEDTGVALDDRPDSKADTLWDNANQKLYVASHIYTAVSSHTTNVLNKGRLYRYSYNLVTQSYSLDTGFGSPVTPVNVNDDKTESLVLDKDTTGPTGRLWVSYVSRPSGAGVDYQVYVNATTAAGLGNDASWFPTPFSLGSIFPEAHVMTDDLSSLVAFGTGANGKIGIMWSNQLSNTVNFATHNDSNPSYTSAPDWTLVTVPVPGGVDDHVSLKSLQATSLGQVFAGVKLTAANPTDPLVGLVTRDTNGTLSFHTYSTKADDDTRPIVIVDQSANLVYVFVTGKAGGSKICYKTATITTPLSAMSFTPGNCGLDFIADTAINKIDNATSSKRPVDSTTGIVVLASDDLNGQFYVHNTLGNPPPVIATRSPGFNATGVPVNSTVSVTFSKVMNQSTLTNADFTVTSSSGAVAGTRSYDSGTRTWTFAPSNPLDTNTVYTATVNGSVQDSSNQSLFGGNDVWTFTSEGPKVQFSSAAYSVSEGVGAAVITATLNSTSSITVSVHYATSNGTAQAGNDYTASSGTLTFTPTVTSQTFTVPIVDDITPNEFNEIVNLTLSSPVSATLGAPATAALTILDNDSPPTVQFDPASFSVNESNGSAIIQVSLSISSPVAITVTYGTSNGTATAVSDYTATTNQLVFNAFQTTKTFTVPIVNDALDEADETVNLALSSPQNATLGAPDDVALLTILDNDNPPTVQFSASGFSVSEASSPATITATLSAPSGLTVTVGYSTSDFTALAGSDYLTATGTLTFTPLVTNMTFTVPILNDALNEADESVNLTMSSPNNATLGANSSAALTILDDNDPPPTVGFSSSTYSVSEGGVTATIAVTLSAPSGQTVSVDYATSNGTATAGSDYSSVSDTLDFARGVTSMTFTVPILEDSSVEGNETILLTLSNPNHATPGTSSAVLTIVDDDNFLYLPLIRRSP